MEPNGSDYDNISYITFFGPLGMAFADNGQVLEDSLTVKLSLSIVLTVMMVVSLIGNGCTCAVIARNRSMRTPTNYYLFNLALTDLFMALFVPIDIYIIWIPDFYPLGEVGCRLHFVLWDCLSNCSLLIITAFTVERYLVISRPFLRQKLSLNSRVFKLVGVIWFVSCCFCVPDLLYSDLMEKKKYVFCYVAMSEIVSIFVAVEIFVFYLIPITIIIILYILITIELKFKKKLRSSPASNGQQNKDKAVIMLAVVALSFFLFWSPYCFLRIMLIWPGAYDKYYNTWKVVNYLCYNSYASSAVNPIIYSLMSRKFRRAFKDFFTRRKSGSTKRNELIKDTLNKNVNKITGDMHQLCV